MNAVFKQKILISSKKKIYDQNATQSLIHYMKHITLFARHNE